jgi:type II secretory pathway component PulF
VSVWRYEAIDIRDPSRPSPRRGELVAPTAAEARAALRGVGLSVVAIREARPGPSSRPDRAARIGRPRGADRERAVDRWLRTRRLQLRADLLDAIATLLRTGVPLLESLDTLLAGGDALPSSLRRSLSSVRDDVRSGGSLASALGRHPGWFDPVEVAAVEAAQVGGLLPDTLAQLADRQTRGAALGQRILSALAYPAVVATVGLFVAAFLATRTLPELATILSNARVEVPALTAAVIAVGAVLSAWWPVLVVGGVGAAIGLAAALAGGARRLPTAARDRLDRAVPTVVRRAALATALRRISELLAAGVPLVEALRVAAPAHAGLVAGLGDALRAAASSIERGCDAASAFDAPAWFDPELRRLIAVGESTGELGRVLAEMAARRERQAARLVDRLASLLEPASIILLAALVGTVAMAAVLPLVRLQEVLR